jgi:hypothetical protein
MPPVQVYSYGTLSVQDVNPNIPAILAQVDLNRRIAANSALNRDDLRHWQGKFVVEKLASSTQGFSTISWR